MWNMVHTEAVLRHEHRLWPGVRDSGKTAFRAIVDQLRPGIGKTRLESAGKPLFDFGLQSVVGTRAVSPVIAGDVLVLGKRAERLSYRTLKPRIRSRDSGRPRPRRVDVGTEIETWKLSQDRRIILVEVRKTAAGNQPCSFVADVGYVEQKIVLQLALERQRPVLVSRKRYALRIQRYDIRSVCRAGVDKRRWDDVLLREGIVPS